MGVAGGGLVGVASCFLKNDFQDRVGMLLTSSSWAVRLSVSGCGLALESVSSTMMCVWWLTVAEVKPGPLT